ncbi:MAG: biotin/lipoyl-binding protein [Lactobacillaceae bacterium]|jgi:HlyD family secretion protein|nr:biotin/lipoyl-binding protein [Lactobacillaceae bacterium]
MIFFNNKKITWIIFSVVLSLLLVVLGINIFQKSQDQSNTKKPEYKLYKVMATPPLTMSGKVQADNTQTLSVPEGKVQALNVKDGQSVKNGEILLTVTSSSVQDDITAQADIVNKANRAVNSAYNSAVSAQQAYNQADDETKSSLVDSIQQAQQALNDANADLQDEQNKLANLQNKLNVNVVAPFDGVVSVGNNNKGQVPTLTVNSAQKILQSSISEYDYQKVHVNDPIIITGVDGVPSQQSNINEIKQIPVSQGKGTSYYPFTANVNNDFLYGQSVKVKIPQNEIKIPKSTVYKDNIYKVVKGKVELIKADVIDLDGSFIVKTGISKGDQIVLKPDNKLKNGDKIND